MNGERKRTWFGTAMALLVAAWPSMGTPAAELPPRPIHWWIGNAHSRAYNAETAGKVTSWTVAYTGAHRPDLEAQRLFRQVGNTTDIGFTIAQTSEHYDDQGARTLANNLENWSTSFTVAEAQAYVQAIDDRPDLLAYQWNSHYTWQSGAIPIIEDHPRLKLIEMVYPTAALNLNTVTIRDFYFEIIRYLRGYSSGKKPAIGLTVYTDHNMTTPVSWEIMKMQIDAAKLAGRDEFGDDQHPIGLFIADVNPTEFTVDDVNRYILRDTSLLTNGQFEDGWTGWAHEAWFGFGAVSLDADGGRSFGSTALRIDGYNAPENRHARAMMSQTVRAAAGTYRFAGHLRTEGLWKADPNQSDTPLASITLVGLDAGGNEIQYTSGGSAGGTTDWQSSVVFFDTHPDTHEIKIVLWTSADHQGSAWFDDLRLERVPPWARIDDLDNLLENPGFETGTRSPWGRATWVGEADPAVVSDARYAGEYALRIDGKGAAYQTVAVSAGSAYNFSAWIKTEGASANLHLDWLQDGGWVGSVGTAQVSGSTDWTQVSETFVVPGNANEVLVYAMKGQSAGTAWFDEVAVRKLEDPVPFEPAPEIGVSSPDGHAGTLRVTWDPAALPDGTALLHVFCEEDAADLADALPIATAHPAAGSLDIRSLESGGTYHLAARAFDADGQSTGQGPAVSATAADKVRPRGGQVQAEWVGDNQVQVGWTPHVLDSDVAQLEIRVGATVLDSISVDGIFDAPRPIYGTAPWITRTYAVSPGATQISVSVIDLSGHTTASPLTAGIVGPYPEGAAADLQVWTAPPTAQIRQDADKPIPTTDSFHLRLLRAQARGFQVMLRPDVSLDAARIRFEPLVRRGGGEEIAPHWLAAHFVNYIELTRNAVQNNGGTRVWDYTAGPFPDELADDPFRDLPAHRIQPVYIRVTAPEGALAGMYDGRLWIETLSGNQSVEFTVEILPETLPAATPFRVGQWIRWDYLADRLGVPIKSDDGWRALHRLADVLAAHRHDYIKVDTQLYDLIGTWVDDGAEIRHDFRELDRFMDTFLSVNPDQLFALSHVGERAYRGWHVPFRPRVHRARSLHSIRDVYLDPIDGLLPGLHDHLVARGLIDQVAVHVADEPTAQTYESYRLLSQRVKAVAPALRRMDAIDLFGDELGEDLDVWVPLITRYQDHVHRLESERAAGAEIWFYTAWSPHGQTLNRMIDEPAIKPQLLHWFSGITGAQGYAHWALNWWDADLYEFNAPGDSFVVYEGHRFIVNSSLRFEAQREGIEDWQLMDLLIRRRVEDGMSESAARAELADMALPAITSSTVYTTDWNVLESSRATILDAYAASSSAARTEWENWALKHFGTSAVDPHDDPDEDGQTNVQEFLAGTDPRNKDSFFHIPETRIEEGRVRLEFDTLPDRHYRLWGSPDLETWTAWEDPAPVSGTGLRETFRIPTPDGHDLFFFRLEIKPEESLALPAG